MIRVAAMAAPVLAAVALALAGCGTSGGSPGKPPPHTPEEEAAIKAANAMTPQQQIEQIEKGPAPTDQKESMIRAIKAKNGLP